MTAKEATEVSVTSTFLIIGGFGVFLLAASLIFGSHVHFGHLHFHLPAHLHLGHSSHSGSDSAFSLPSVAGFVGAFGFGGAIAAALTHSSGALVPSLVGLAAAVPTAWGA